MKKLTKLDTASIIAVRDCMAVKKNEKVLIITDETKSCCWKCLPEK